jgi:hypothetical protein
VSLFGNADNLLSAVTSVKHIVGLGQSSSIGTANGAVASSVPAFAGRVQMFNGGVRVLGSDHSSPWLNEVISDKRLENFVDAFEVVNGLAGDTGMTAVATRLANNLYTAGDAAVLVSNHGIASQSYTGLAKGTTPWSNMLAAVRRGRIVSRLNGREYDLLALRWLQGEQDAGIDPAVYEAFLVQQQSDFQTAVNAILDDSAATRPLIGMQVSNSCNQNPPKDPTVGQGLLQAAIDNPLKIVCPGPSYLYPTVSDGTHITAAGNVSRAVVEARFLQRFLQGQDALPLYCKSAVQSSTRITLTFHLPADAANIQFSTAICTDPGNKGINFTQTGGNSPTITNVTISAPNKVLVDFDVAPNGTAKKIGIGWFNPGGATQTPAGPTTGSRTTIACDAIGNDHACQQLIGVT